MNKQFLTTIILLITGISLNSQTFNVDYLYNVNSGNCIKVNFQIQLKTGS